MVVQVRRIQSKESYSVRIWIWNVELSDINYEEQKRTWYESNARVDMIRIGAKAFIGVNK